MNARTQNIGLILEGLSLKKYEIEKFSRGYLIKCKDTRYPNKERYLYVSKIKKDGTPEFSSDYTYAKSFSSEDIAKKTINSFKE